jgi:hypothetical protein
VNNEIKGDVVTDQASQSTEATGTYTPQAITGTATSAAQAAQTTEATATTRKLIWKLFDTPHTRTVALLLVDYQGIALSHQEIIEKLTDIPDSTIPAPCGRDRKGKKRVCGYNCKNLNDFYVTHLDEFCRMVAHIREVLKKHNIPHSPAPATYLRLSS